MCIWGRLSWVKSVCCLDCSKNVFFTLGSAGLGIQRVLRWICSKRHLTSRIPKAFHWQPTVTEAVNWLASCHWWPRRRGSSPGVPWNGQEVCPCYQFGRVRAAQSSSEWGINSRDVPRHWHRDASHAARRGIQEGGRWRLQDWSSTRVGQAHDTLRGVHHREASSGPLGTFRRRDFGSLASSAHVLSTPRWGSKLYFNLGGRGRGHKKSYSVWHSFRCSCNS